MPGIPNMEAKGSPAPPAGADEAAGEAAAAAAPDEATEGLAATPGAVPVTGPAAGAAARLASAPTGRCLIRIIVQLSSKPDAGHTGIADGTLSSEEKEVTFSEQAIP